jgi:glyoxylase-like metal-dependent hydrolase (beta-lactamase superfamily II)
MSGIQKLIRGLAIAACTSLGAMSAALAASPDGMKLYVFSSGWLNIEKSALISTAPPGRFRIPVAFFLIKHPKGNVLFDTGNNDKIITDPAYWGPNIAAIDPGRSPDVAIDTQLAKIGVKPSDINYVVLGHMHLDHAGNVGKFPTATIVYQRDEILNAFWPKPNTAGPYITGDFAGLRSGLGNPLGNAQPVIELDGDLDLFGDGSIFIHRSVGHTPGSELALVRLPKTGLVILTSDASYSSENLNQNILPSIGLAYDPTGILNGYAYIRRQRDMEHGDVIFAHDPDVFKAHKQAPDFYE